MVLDTESRQRPVGSGWQQTWRLACTETFQGHAARTWTDPVSRFHGTPMDLWAWVLELAKPSHRLVIWCHNAGYDLRISQAIPWLTNMGLTLEGINLEHSSSWARFTGDGRTVLFVDLLSWLPAALAKIAPEVGEQPSRRLALDADDELWRARCEQDVRVTGRAVRQLLEFVEAEDLGPWRPTGSGQSHSAWRRRFFGARPLVHDQVEVLKMERQAAWTGRCEAWRWGPLDTGPYTEYDLDFAYCQIAADSTVPSVLAGQASGLTVDDVLRSQDRYATISRVRVNTDQEVVPTEHNGFIVWPVGAFETVVWEPELQLLADAGAKVEIVEAHVYRRAPVLQDMARWVIRRLREPPAGQPPVAGRLLKHWARAMIGRMALRYHDWELWGDADDETVQLGLIEFRDTGHVTELLQVGGQMRILSELRESPESLPQITGWVMSECRRRVWQLMRAAGVENVVYVDTDALVVTAAGRARLEGLLAAGGGWPIKVKGVYRRMTVHGPRMLELDDQRRMAGVPLAARLNPDGRLSGEVFVSLKESMIRAQTSSVSVLTRMYQPIGVDRRREHLDGGWTRPHRIIAEPRPR